MKLHAYLRDEDLTFFGSFEELLIEFFEDRDLPTEKLEKIGALVMRAGDEELELLYVVLDFEYEDAVEELEDQLIEDVKKILED